MAQLLVRKVDPKVLAALKRRARAHGRSAEAEHREILRSALLDASEGGRFKALLRAMPNVGEEGDFERIAGDLREVEW